MSTQLAERPAVLATYAPAAEAGITQDQWLSLTNSIFPGARPESIMLAVSYCRARRFDFLRRPVHIVPMNVKVPGTRDKYEWRDIIMEGIASIRITASRTGNMAGTDAPVFGPTVSIPVTNAHDAPDDVLRIDVPEWCSVTVYALDKNGVPRPYTHIEYYLEACARARGGRINDMWERRNHGQLAKCAEAGALRKAFPEELGNVYVKEEMEGKEIDGDAITGEFSVVGKGEGDVPEPDEIHEPTDDKPEPAKEAPAKEQPKEAVKETPKAEQPKEPEKAKPEPAKEMPVQSESFTISLPEGAIKLLRKKMADAEVTDSVVHAKFGNVTVGNVNEVLRFLQQHKE